MFGKNLEQLLMQPPIAGQTVLGWDPARTGCKLAVVDPTGKVLDTTVIYPTAPTTEAKIPLCKGYLEKNGLKIPYHPLFRGKRHGLQGIRAGDRGTV